LSFFDTKVRIKLLDIIKGKPYFEYEILINRTYRIISAPASLIVQRFELNSEESNTTAGLFYQLAGYV